MGFEEFIPSVSNLPAADGVLEDGKTVLDCMAQPGTSFQALSEAEPQDGFSLALKEALSDWQIILTPGHTSGSVCFYNKKEKVLISGDTLFYGSWGRTDLGGSEAEIMKSLRFLRENIDPDTVVFPGHDYCGFKMGDNL